LIEDIVKSKGYTIYKNWKRRQKSLDKLVDLNAKINQKPIIEESKIEKVIINSLEQLTFEF